MLEQRDEWSAVKPGPGGDRGHQMVFQWSDPAKSLTYRAGLRPEFDLEKKIRAPRERESRADHSYFAAEEVQGPILKLWKVSRMDMGAYMCIARYSSLAHSIIPGKTLYFGPLPSPPLPFYTFYILPPLTVCVSRNGVPPAVSKRIELGIDCEYQMIVSTVHCSLFTVP